VEAIMARDTKEQEQLSAPLAGEDAERLVAYIEQPAAPAGHNEYLHEADAAYSEIKPRADEASA
jgi:hypothetical protein